MALYLLNATVVLDCYSYSIDYAPTRSLALHARERLSCVIFTLCRSQANIYRITEITDALDSALKAYVVKHRAIANIVELCNVSKTEILRPESQKLRPTRFLLGKTVKSQTTRILGLLGVTENRKV